MEKNKKNPTTARHSFKRFLLNRKCFEWILKLSGMQSSIRILFQVEKKSAESWKTFTHMPMRCFHSFHSHCICDTCAWVCKCVSSDHSFSLAWRLLYHYLFCFVTAFGFTQTQLFILILSFAFVVCWLADWDWLSEWATSACVYA